MVQPPPYTDANTTLTPYLQLPHLLSLTWLAYPILSLIFVAFRLQASMDTAQNAIASAKDDLLASCKAAERAATAAASMPRYMALATNQQFADAVNGSLNTARAALVLSLTAIEGIINFLIDLYRSIFLCFLELVVRGGLSVLLAAVEEINKVVGTISEGLQTSIQSSIGSANQAISSAFDTINRINPFSNIPVPQIPIPSLDGLDNVQLPDSLRDSIVKFNDTIPTVSSVKEKLEAIINTPFELLKKDINDTFSTIQFSGSTLPVPAQNQLSFCSEMDMSVVDDIGRDIIKSFKIGIAILVVIALLLIGINCLLTWYKWRCMKSHLEYTRQAWMSDPTLVHTKGSLSSTPQVTLSDHNLLILHANSSHPLVTRITNQLSARLRLTPSQHTNLQWFFNYIFHPPAAACFLIGFFGILLVQIQLLAMGPMVARYQDQAANQARDFSLVIANSINQSMLNQSTLYAQQVNAQVDAAQTTINDGVFGWVNITTTQVNTTINEVYEDIQNAVKTVFGEGPLAVPANEFIKCLIGSKVDAIENALTFMHDNLKIDMPRVNPNVLILSPESVSEASTPIAAAAIGGGSDDDQGLVGRLVNSYANTLKKERVTFGIFLALWGFVVLMGIAVILWHSYGLPLLEKRRRRRYQREQRGVNPDDFVVTYRDGTVTPPLGGGGLRLTNEGEKWDGGMHNGSTPDLPQFTPLPSPRRSVFKPFWASRANSPSLAGDNALDLERSKNKNESAESLRQEEKVSRLKAIRMKLKSSKGDAESQQVEQGSNRNGGGGWLGRVKGAFAKKEPEPEHNFWDSYNERPRLKIVVDTPSDMSYAEPQEPEFARPPPNSRWSTSPTEPTSTEPSWRNILSISKKSAPETQPSITSSSPILAPAKPTDRLIPPPPGLRHKPSVPSDIGGSLEDPFLASITPNSTNSLNSNNPYHKTYSASNFPETLVPSVYPVPLHSVYQGTDSFAPPPSHPSIRRTPPSPPSDSSTRSHAHRRVSSVPVWRVTNFSPSDQVSVSSSSATSSPVITTAALRPLPAPPASMLRDLVPGQVRHPDVNVNPFITPFDDEHRVEIVTPAATGAAGRKSMLANPFVTTGVAF